MNFSPSAQKEIDKLYKNRHFVNLSIGVLKDGVMECVTYGPEREVLEGAMPVYPVGSICKLFVASLLAKYVSEGKLELSAPLSRYIKGLPERYFPSLEKLATHTSGFKTQPYTPISMVPILLNMNREGGLFHTNPFRGTVTRKDMLRIIMETKLEDKPYPFVYSNIGMGILGYILGEVSGEGFWDSMNRYIREDLGLENTFIGNVDMVGRDKKENPCEPWRWEKEDIIAPAGALNSSVEDLLKFAQLNMDGSHPYLSICHEVHGPCEKNAESGLAWRLEKDAPISWHGGAAGAFSAFLGLNRETGEAVAVAVNYGLVNAEAIGHAMIRGL